MALPKVSARRLTAKQVQDLWSKFYAVCGPEEMMMSFGWDSPQIIPAPVERVWSFHDEAKVLVGWGSSQMSLRYPDDEAVLSCGVFPEHRRHGYWHAITEWMCREAKRRGAERATRFVNAANEEHYARSKRNAVAPDEAKVGDWIHSGEIWYPKPYGVFTRVL